jgi:hypothetical protein
VRIRDTKHLDLTYVSGPALRDVLATGRCEIVRPLARIAFDAAGMFERPAPWADGYQID